MKAEIKRFSEPFALKRWFELIVDDELVNLLTGPAFLKYDRYLLQSAVADEESQPINKTIVEFVKFGGSDVINVSMKALMAMVIKYAPHRPDRILLVGLLSDRNVKDIFGSNKPDVSGNGRQVFMQWCKVDEGVSDHSFHERLLLSDACEEGFWFGKL
eukprot:gene8243-9090_t